MDRLPNSSTPYSPSPDVESRGEIVIFEPEAGGPQLEVQLESETLWLSQRKIGELFDRDPDTISGHLSTIYKDGELDEGRTTGFFPVVQTEGTRQVRRTIKFYNLDAIISVGYRVNSK
ncbi:MAG TPA: RhuM family protein, partial [Candidatus Kapabacteria bacterium]|nr:RhuM family protein [Candidatus Kapabacteria bacterium]